MYQITDAHFLTIVIVIGTMMVTPLYVFATYVYSGASRAKGMKIAAVFLLFGAFMSWVCLSGKPRELGWGGRLIIPVVWALPSLILYWGRDWFLSDRLSQKWIVGLQLFRVIGGVFLIEMVMGNIPGIFAYPAGVGDIIAALVALVVLVKFRAENDIPKNALLLVIVVGMVDFMGAFFFGFTSSENPMQLFFPEVRNNVVLFPTGMIPLFLVPYAIFFHMLSWLNYSKFESERVFKD